MMLDHRVSFIGKILHNININCSEKHSHDVSILCLHILPIMASTSISNCTFFHLVLPSTRFSSSCRYIAVCHPISSPRFRTNVIARVVSLTAWASSALLMVPVFMYAATVTKRVGGENCNIFWPFDEDKEGEEEGFKPGQHFLNGQVGTKEMCVMVLMTVY